ncbi:SGNH/GDSL hydrolase family protein [Oleiagrimonas sp. C23AA]|uniref:SGNH/GDSL hydrolase family protein n=1 Tax=Oleiagrimonas sp. C23AA TaxID=2719047 RepID=UPI001422E5D4|nr:SGNH/GDSL hydrolase family protein [Oleiagrimonas sp. C23AA]NII12190.1 SGNH/GDSL hydrolase family protein [Oleiagrimonas sp. C23AA]
MIRSSRWALVALSLALSGNAMAVPVTHWTGAWMAAMIPAPVTANAYRQQPIDAITLHDQTLRQMVHISADGQKLRLRFSNTYGARPLTIDAASVGLRAEAGSAGVLAPSLRTLRFRGRRAVTIPAGASFLSDAVALPVKAGQTLAISLHVPGTRTPKTWHLDARQTSYISRAGNFVDATQMPVAGTTGSVYWLSGVEVSGGRTRAAVVTLGDSITNGYHSSLGSNHRYPDALARRLRGQCRRAVLNAGIDGNEVAAFESRFGNGDSMLARFDRDVLGQAGVRDVLLLGGINDIGEPTMAASAHGKTVDGAALARQVIAGLHQIILKAHAAHLKIYGATILPFAGTQGAYSVPGEKAREAINAWIRHKAGYDGVVDFDKLMRDPRHRLHIRPEYDSGGHLHPNDAGYKAMAKAIPLRWFGCP